ncbi:MAG: alpha/beta-type small acid-soluble spore protein [Clostridiales bacterium]|nr:alpha/beta-type small acid-soluble spore protein [Clostridiales bacterium]
MKERKRSDQSLDRLKYEVAEELGLDDDIEERGWSRLTTREVGKIGGAMVRKMIRKARREWGKDPERPT